MRLQDFNRCKNKMDNRIKIFLGVVIFLGLVSGVFLLFSKKKTVVAPTVQKNVASQPEAPVNHLNTVQASDVVAQQNATDASNADIANSQMKVDWQSCSKTTMSTRQSLYWRFKIVETIPQGGTYAKATVLGLQAFPVNIAVRAASPDAPMIKNRINAGVGNTISLRGSCFGVSADGSVNFEAY